MGARLRVAVVGLGIGKSHLQAFARLPEQYEIVALCDTDSVRLGAGAAQFNVARRHSTLEELIAAGGLDVIDLCTPPFTHRALIEQSLAAGVDVICEKPLVGSLADADAIAGAAARAKGRLFPIFQYRFGNGIAKLKHLQAKGFARYAYFSTIETLWNRGAQYYAVPWRGKWATELGGCCLGHAIHAHDMLSYVIGPAQSVFAHLATRVNPIESEDCAAISLRMADGSLATLSVTLGAAEEISRLRFIFSDLTAESRGTEPYRPGKDPWHFKGKTPELDAGIAEALADFLPALEGFEGQFAAVYTAISGRGPAPVTLADARQSLELITAIYHSGETGEAVTLPVAPNHPKYRSWIPAAGGFDKSFGKAIDG